MDTDLGTVDASFIGENEGDQAGEVAVVGDVNGDGYDDILIGALGSTGSGQAYLIFGKPSGWEIDTNLSEADASFIGEKSSDGLGRTVSGGGDVNGDGYNDFLITALGSDEGGDGAGQIYLILGKASGWTRDTSISNADASFIGENAADAAGYSSAIVGDVNNDTFDDILIGAPYNDEGEQGAGQVYLIFGKATGWSMDTDLSNADASFIGEHPSPTVWKDAAGYSVAGAGDVNNDGFDDILISSWDNHEGGGRAGQVYLILGKNSGWSMDADLKNSDASFIGENSEDHAGQSVDCAGDVNGDGYDDFVIGAFMNKEGGNYAGQVYIIFGKSVGWSMDTDLSSVDASYLGEKIMDNAGNDVAGVGDVNNDGFDDILISAVYNSGGAANAGQVYLILGKSAGWSMDKDLSNSDSSFLGEMAQEYVGTSIDGGGDVNGDGNVDILIGSKRNGEGGQNAGQVYLIFPELNFGPKIIYSVKAYSDITYTSEAFTADINDNIYVELTGLDEKPASKDLAFVNITSTFSSPEGFRLPLIETGLNTGTYHGNFKISNRTNAALGLINATIGEDISITSFRDQSKNVTVTVNTPIQLRPVFDKTDAVEDELYYMNYNAIGYNQVSSWTFESNATWLSWDTNTHNLSGTPDNGDVGSYWVRINITDGLSHYDEHYFTLKVQNTLPQILTDNDYSALEDELYTMDYESDDEGLGSAQWLLKTNATWLSIDSTTGNISGTANNSQRGPFWVKVTMDDGNGGSAFTNFTLTVYDTNDAPLILTDDIISILEDQFYYVDYEATDIDGATTFQWYLETDTPCLTIDKETGVLSGTPTNDDVGTHFVNVTVLDDRNGSTSRNFTLEVINVNDHPFWSDVPQDITIDEGEWFIFDVNATDVDVGDTLSYDLYSESAINISIEPKTGLIKWKTITNGEGDLYKILVTVRATDGIYPIETLFNISVLENPRPSTFLLNPSDDGFAALSETVFQWDGDDEFDEPLTYNVYLHQKESFVSLLREDALLLERTEQTTYSTDGLEISETYYWTVIPNDGLNYGICVDGIFSFMVNTPPVITPIDDLVITAGESIVLDLIGIDMNPDDKELLEFSLGSAPKGIFIDNTRNILTWEPTKFQQGTHTIQVFLTDGKDFSNITFEIEVGENEQDSKSSQGNTLYLSILALIIVLVLLFVIIMMVVRKRKSRFRSELGASTPESRFSVLPRFFVGKPGALSGPTITIDPVTSPAQHAQMQAQAGVAQSYAQPQSTPVPVPTPVIPPPTVTEPAQLPPAPFEPQGPVPAHAPVPTPVPEPAPEVVEDDVVPDFGLEKGPQQVQKDAIVHDIAFEQVHDEPDLSAVLEDLKAAGVIKPTEEGTVIHEADTGVWRPDARGKATESKEVLEQIEMLSDLKAKGALTEDEFERKKQELLN
jgi:hypothetical protein